MCKPPQQRSEKKPHSPCHSLQEIYLGNDDLGLELLNLALDGHVNEPRAVLQKGKDANRMRQHTSLHSRKKVSTHEYPFTPTYRRDRWESG